MRCGNAGPIELDHPDGRLNGRPLIADVTVSLCKPCHHRKGVIDRAADVEGGEPTLRQMLARRAAGLEFLAARGQPILVPARFFADLARVLACIARQIPAHWKWTADG